MQYKAIIWCFKIKDGLKIVEPNQILSKTYLEQAKSSMLRANKNFEDKDLLWTTVTAYYAEYYALYSFLQKIGISCENHMCSIMAVTKLLGKEKTKKIIEHKEKRIDAQYYILLEQEEKVRQILKEAKFFISEYEDFVSNLTEKEIIKYRNEISSMI